LSKSMNYEKFVFDLPRENRVSFDSLEETQEAMDDLDVCQEMRQLGTGVYQCDMSVRLTKDAGLFADRFSKGQSIHLEPPAGSIGLFIPRTAGGTFVASGSKISNDKLVFVHDCGTDIVAPDLMGSESIVISKSRFNELAEALCPSLKLQEKTCVIEGDTAQLHTIRDCILELIGQQAEPDDEQLSKVISSIFSWAENTAGTNLDARNSIPSCKKARIAKLAQQFIHERFREEVKIEDICRVTGVGVRTLQRSFGEYFNITLTQYLKAVRLNSAHQELSIASSTQVTVAEIALRNGCKHLGRFSTDFHKHFGTSPSNISRH
jgi:AraC-like DNA-binding protein